MDFLLKNYLVIPDFEYYSQEKNLIILLNRSENFKTIATQIVRGGTIEVENKLSLSTSNISYLKKLDTFYFDKSILKIILNEPIWINLVSRTGTSNAVSIFDTRFEKYEQVKKCVEPHNQYNEIARLVRKYSSSGINNALDIF